MIDQQVSTNLQTLFEQAPRAAATYMREAVKAIDDTFGEGHAKKNPALVAAFMQAAAVDLHGSLLKVGLQELTAGLEELSDAVNPGSDSFEDEESVADTLAGGVVTTT